MTQKHKIKLLKDVRALALLSFYLLIVVMAFCSGSFAFADDYFDPSFLSGIAGAENIDLSNYEKPNYTPPGVYLVDIYVNGDRFSTKQVEFYQDKNDKEGKSIPLFTKNDLVNMGVDISNLPDLKDKDNSAPVGDLTKVIPKATVNFDFSTLTLKITIPQLYQKYVVSGFVDPALWDEGIPALVVNYNVNASKYWYQAKTRNQNQSVFSNVSSVLNLGPWRLHSGFSFNYSQNKAGGEINENRSFNRQNIFMQRDVIPLKADFSLGELSAETQIMDSFAFTGVTLRSNDSMLPSSERGFSPIITGIAKSNAKVTISQKGRIIYQTDVPPGPFRITNISSGLASGDLLITVTEADGSQHSSTQSISTLPIMERPGAFNYSLSAGRYGDSLGSYKEKPLFMLGSFSYGLPMYVTTYGSGLISNHYQSMSIGAGYSLGTLGALSTDVTIARANINHKTLVGESYNIKYSKDFSATGTSVNIAAYRYNTRNYYSFADVNGNGYTDDDNYNYGRAKNSYTVTINQKVTDSSYLYFTGLSRDYWDSNRKDINLSFNYDSSFRGVGYSIGYSQDYNMYNGIKGDTNRSLNFNVSIPFSLFTDSSTWSQLSPNISYSSDLNGSSSQQISLSGIVGDANQLGWNVSAMKNTDPYSSDYDVSTQFNYNSNYGAYTAGLSKGSNSTSVNMTWDGGVVIHPHGIVFSPSAQGAIALVETPKVAGVKTLNGQSGKSNSSGYLVVSSLSPYGINDISLDPTSFPDNAQINQNSLKVYPTADAVVLAKFQTLIGHQVFMHISYHGHDVPFGAATSLENTKVPDESIVGQDGMAYLSGLPDKGVIDVLWGSKANQHCKIHYDLSPYIKESSENDDYLQQLDQTCI